MSKSDVFNKTYSSIKENFNTIKNGAKNKISSFVNKTVEDGLRNKEKAIVVEDKREDERNRSFISRKNIRDYGSSDIVNKDKHKTFIAIPKKDEDDDPNFRDKDKELRNLVKSVLSDETVEIINNNEMTVEEVIEKLKKMGLSKDKAVEMIRMKNIGSKNNTRNM